ncbi:MULTISPECIES: hypothetical protein [Halorussus]|uniref:hypothetical protein n=1 Tax=Halorussus TaxID=1070314 RepID=UPI0013B3A8A3|nr:MULTISPECIES: hypothetical protein [Halorussus]NHN61343.1 hypothetical protein [Halorussus sp. JP-T4]
MNCPPLRARAFGSFAASAASGVKAFGNAAGSIPVADAERGTHMGDSTYRLERTTPTA